MKGQKDVKTFVDSNVTKIRIINKNKKSNYKVKGFRNIDSFTETKIDYKIGIK